MDHNYLSVMVAGAMVALGVLGFLVRGWFQHVNSNLVAIWEELKAERRAREERWETLHRQCNRHGERISVIEGVLSLWKEEHP